MEEEYGEDRYRAAVGSFYEIFRPLQKKYDMRAYMHFSIYDNGWIEIWEHRGEEKGKCILRVEEPGETDCFERAAGELAYYKKMREGEEPPC